MSASSLCMKALREHRRANKLCVDCGEPAAFLSASCEACTESRRKQKLLASLANRKKRLPWISQRWQPIFKSHKAKA